MNIGTSPMAWAGGAIAAQDQRGARNRCRVLAALRMATQPLAIKTVSALTGLSYFQVRLAMEKLCAYRAVEASGPLNSRLFRITGTGLVTGGPASDSAGPACAGDSSTVSARPGSAAA